MLDSISLIVLDMSCFTNNCTYYYLADCFPTLDAFSFLAFSPKSFSADSCIETYLKNNNSNNKLQIYENIKYNIYSGTILAFITCWPYTRITH